MTTRLYFCINPANTFRKYMEKGVGKNKSIRSTNKFMNMEYLLKINNFEISE